MNNKIKFFGGIIGSAIVIPATIISVAGFGMAAMFNEGFKGKDGEGLKLGIILSVLAMVLSMATPALTVTNFVKPENEFRKISGILILVAGVMAIASIIYTLTKDFSMIQLFVLLGAIAMSASGYLQVQAKE